MGGAQAVRRNDRLSDIRTVLSEMATGCYETIVLLFVNTRGAGTLLTTKCPAPGTHRATNARGGARGWN